MDTMHSYTQMATTASLEQSEISYWSKFYASQHPAIPCYTLGIGNAFACAIPSLDVLAMNRVIGLGLQEKFTHKHLEQCTRFYQKVGVKRFMAQVTPEVLQQDSAEVLEAFGFRHHNNWVKLTRNVALPVSIQGNADITIRALRTDEADLFGRIIFDSFDWEDERLPKWIAATVGQPDYYHYLALLDEKPAGAAALHITGKFASMSFAGTLPEFRSQGIQTYLLTHRIRQAQLLGCRVLVSETAEEKPGRPVTSYRNMQKVGFEVAYFRQNWLLEC